jgi:hypothetical protein
MTWMQNGSSFSMDVSYHSIFSTHPIGMTWLIPSTMSLNDIISLDMSKKNPWDIARKNPNFVMLLDKL